MRDLAKIPQLATASAAEIRISDAQWQSQRRDAWERWSASSRARAESAGKAFFDYAAWLAGRAAAVARHRRALEAERRRKGDAELKEAAESLVGSFCPGVPCREDGTGGYRMTKSRAKVIAAIVATAADTGRLFSSYASLARRAGVSERTACTVRSELESLGALVRVRTGGKSAEGRGQSNKYTVMHNRLREILGVEVRWESRYEGEVGTVPAVPNPYFNFEGFAHYSRSERQRRRLRQRAKAAAQQHSAELEAMVKRAFKGFFDIVENPSLLGETAGGKLSAAEKQGDELQFCALTELKNRNKPSCPEPKRTDVENLTRKQASEWRRANQKSLRGLLAAALKAAASGFPRPDADPDGKTRARTTRNNLKPLDRADKAPLTRRGNEE